MAWARSNSTMPPMAPPTPVRELRDFCFGVFSNVVFYYFQSFLFFRFFFIVSFRVSARLAALLQRLLRRHQLR